MPATPILLAFSLPLPSKKPCDKRKRKHYQAPTTQLPAVTKIQTVPSIRFRGGGVPMEMASTQSTTAQADEDASSVPSSVLVEAKKPKVRPDEPNLYEIPRDIYPTYRSTPIWIRSLVVVVSSLLAALKTWPNFRFHLDFTLWSARLAISRQQYGKFFAFATRTFIAVVLTSIALQEVFFGPSRIATSELIKQYWLPSVLSQYSPVQYLDSSDSSPPITGGVHYLRYDGSNTPTEKQKLSPYRFDAIYVNHGFGASSLSWLPALPKLVNRLSARVGLGHDAVGFGFTERPSNNNVSYPYTSEGSARIGSTLLSKHLPHTASETPPCVLLMGHSMGCATTLRMALALPSSTRKTVVLVAPALAAPSNLALVRHLPRWMRPIARRLRSILVERPFSYLLRRLVGGKGFWKKGLQAAWGDPSKVTESDQLRFQWPSIGKGWEHGLVQFTGAATSGSNNPGLLEKVTNLPNTTVSIIHGTKDKVISIDSSHRLSATYPKVQIVELEGQGHDPFEEQVDVFVEKVEELVATQSTVQP